MKPFSSSSLPTLCTRGGDAECGNVRPHFAQMQRVSWELPRRTALPAAHTLARSKFCDIDLAVRRMSGCMSLPLLSVTQCGTVCVLHHAVCVLHHAVCVLHRAVCVLHCAATLVEHSTCICSFMMLYIVRGLQFMGLPVSRTSIAPLCCVSYYCVSAASSSAHLLRAGT
ncbi:hypothetical protein C8R47DRAFT_571361 [Mycena vitilis]|nr:hypothetical protein C8R47DRAFT_571361 [Mycena vitilis]